MSSQSSGSSWELNPLPKLPKNRGMKIGCIGAGFIMADCHLVAYKNAGFQPAAIASRNPDNARRAAERHAIPTVHQTYQELVADPQVEILDVAVPPDVQLAVIREAVQHADHLKGILAQKPLGMNLAEAREIVRLCAEAGIVLAVNQNMRYDQSVRACKHLLDSGEMGEPVLATIDMRAIPHWMPWQQRLGWVTLRIMSIHHLDTFRYWFGTPTRVFASIRPDPRTARQFAHQDGICLYILEYENGLRASSWDDVWAGPAREGTAADIGIRYRVEGTHGLALGSIGWPDYPKPTPSTLKFSTTAQPTWQEPTWKEVWFPDAFAGTMAQLMCALEENREPEIGGQDNLETMALVDACYLSAQEHRAVELAELLES